MNPDYNLAEQFGNINSLVSGWKDKVPCCFLQKLVEVDASVCAPQMRTPGLRGSGPHPGHTASKWQS